MHHSLSVEVYSCMSDVEWANFGSRASIIASARAIMRACPTGTLLHCYSCAGSLLDSRTTDTR